MSVTESVFALAAELRRLQQQVAPWVGMDEMCIRYDCTPATIRAMERRGDIPARVKGRWYRPQLCEWESRVARRTGAASLNSTA